MRRCAFVTLGCKANHYDTQVVREQILADGYEEVAPDASADLFVINTCTVTHRSGRKSRQEIRRIVRNNPHAVVVVTGCYADSDRDVLVEMDGVDMVLPNTRKTQIAGLVRASPKYREEEPVPVWGPQNDPPVAFGISSYTGQTRAFVKIEEGCDVFCSFCIIPYVRGPVRSRPVEEVLEEVTRLAESGYREVVLTGIHLGGYGQDHRDPTMFVRLLRALEEVPGLERVRISSIDQWELTDEILGTVAELPRVASHLHIPLQAGDDGVLERMRRRYTRAGYLRTIEQVRELMPDIALTTDVIVGFPGEDQAAFEQTLATCREAGFMKIHIFPYSDRQGTSAWHFQPKVPESEKANRSARLAALESELAIDYKRRFLGTRIPVLVESTRDVASGKLAGYSDRYVRALFDGPDSLQNRILPVEVTEISPTVVMGRVPLVQGVEASGESQ